MIHITNLYQRERGFKDTQLYYYPETEPEIKLMNHPMMMQVIILQMNLKMILKYMMTVKIIDITQAKMIQHYYGT